MVCNAHDLNETIFDWIKVAGGADVLDHKHCGMPSFTHKKGPLSGTWPGCYTQQYLFTATFNEGKVEEVVAGHISTYDHDPPVFHNIPSSINVACHKVPPLNDLQASDACMNTIPHQESKQKRIDEVCPQTYTLLREWKITDDCGNHDTANQTVIVVDEKPPVFPEGSNVQYVQCTGNVTEDIAHMVSRHLKIHAKDNCSDALMYSVSQFALVLKECSGTGQAEFELSATDECGYSVTQNVTLHIIDEEPPVPVNIPKDTTVECSAVPGIAQSVCSVDICSGERIETEGVETRQDGRCSQEYLLNRTFTFTDACENAVETVQVVTVQDTQPPEILRQPSTLVLECHQENNDKKIAEWLTSQGDAVAVDECSEDLVTWSHNYDEVKDNLVGGCGKDTGVINVTFSVVDECGQYVHVSALIVLEDTQPPVFERHLEDKTLTCGEALQLETPLVKDNCTENIRPQLTMNRTDGKCPSEYFMVRTWFATDSCGHSTRMDHAVTVTSNKPPSLVNNGTISFLECSVENNEANFAAFLSDHGGIEVFKPCGNISWTYSQASTLFVENRTLHEIPLREHGCGNTFSTTARFYATDDCGNRAHALSTLIVHDTRPPQPEKSFQEEIHAACDAVPPLVSISVIDQCTGEMTASGKEERIEESCSQSYTLQRTYSAIDNCSNEMTAVQLVRVTDQEPPMITQTAAGLTLQCGNTTEEEIADWLAMHANASAKDNCSSRIIWSNNYDKVKDELWFGWCGENAINVTFFAMDECGNVATTIARLEVVDTIPPVFIEVPSNETRKCDAKMNEVYLEDYIARHGGAVPKDSCIARDDLVWTHITQTMQLCGESVINNILFTVEDRCGNNATATAALHIVDTEKPVLELIGDDPQVTPVQFLWIDPSVRIAKDRCHNQLTPDHVEIIKAPNTTTLANESAIYRVEDACGFVGTARREVHVEDTLPPVVIEEYGARRLLVREGTPFYASSVRAEDNWWATVNVLTVVVADGKLDADVVNAAQATNRTHFHVLHYISDGSGNTAVHTGTTVHVLPQWSSDEAIYSSYITLVFDRTLTLNAESYVDAPHMPRNHVLPQFYYARAVTTVPMNVHTLYNDDLALVFGGNVRDYSIVAEYSNPYCMESELVVAGETGQTFAEARRDDRLLALTHSIRVLSFHGSLQSRGGKCSGVHDVDDEMKRTGRTLLWKDCDRCMCVYSAAEPAADGQFDSPRLEQAKQYHVRLRERNYNSFDIPQLQSRLYEMGVIPIRLFHGDDNRVHEAVFVTRTPLPSNERMMWMANAIIEAESPIVGTELVLKMEASVSEVTLLNALYNNGIVPETTEAGVLLTLLLETNNNSEQFFYDKTKI